MAFDILHRRVCCNRRHEIGWNAKGELRRRSLREMSSPTSSRSADDEQCGVGVRAGKQELCVFKPSRRRGERRSANFLATL
eukprot:scaffold8927_cov176-Amphora_coffeaeformis.AAC.1